MKNLLRTLPEKILYFFSWLLSKLINGKKNLKEVGVKRILVFKQDEIGDLCYSLHVFSMLRKQYPTSEITLLCKPFAVSLTSHHPDINKVTSSFNDLSGHYDLIADLRGSWASLSFALFNRPSVRLDRGTVRFANKRKGKHPHEVLTNLQVIAPVIDEKNQSTSPHIHTSEADRQKAFSFLSSNISGPFAMIHTGARKQLRKWDKFDELAMYLKQHAGLEVIFTGDTGDKEEIEKWQQKIGFKTWSIAGKFNLSEFAALVSMASVYVGNESGPLHIAAVCGTPSIGLFGPGEPFVFYPWGKHTKYIHHVLSCNPCDQVHCVHPEHPCIRRITLTEVTEQIKSLTQI